MSVDFHNCFIEISLASPPTAVEDRQFKTATIRPQIYQLMNNDTLWFSRLPHELKVSILEYAWKQHELYQCVV